MIKVLVSESNLVKCRTLLDSGSEVSFKSSNCMRKLCLQRRQFTWMDSYSAERNGEIILKCNPHLNSGIKFNTKE